MISGYVAPFLWSEYFKFYNLVKFSDAIVKVDSKSKATDSFTLVVRKKSKRGFLDFFKTDKK